MRGWTNDSELFTIIGRELFTAVIGDVLDSMNRRNQFLPPQIRPLAESMCIIGRAMPVREQDCSDEEVHNNSNGTAFGLMFEALDALQSGEVYVCTGSSPSYALWGENMSTRAMKLDAAGAIVDGYSRDTVGICDMRFPTFSWGGYARDQKFRGRVVDYRCSVTFRNNVTVEPGDFVFGDVDGVVIVPQDLEEKVIETALSRVRSEHLVHNALSEGLSAREAFQTYGIM